MVRGATRQAGPRQTDGRRAEGDADRKALRDIVKRHGQEVGKKALDAPGARKIPAAPSAAARLLAAALHSLQRFHRKEAPMWRYKLVRMDLSGWEESQLKASEARLNDLGGEGWEAVAVIEQGGGWGVLFKMAHEVASF
jgi:hypothetical protein